MLNLAERTTKAPAPTDRLLEEIRETNLSYLMLAQNLIREDLEQALYRLGISAETAELIASLSPGQILKVAASNLLMCRFRFDDQLVWNLLTGHSRDRAASVAHAGILISQDFAQAA